MSTHRLTTTTRSLYWTSLTLMTAVVFIELLLHGNPVATSLRYSFAVLCGLQAAIQLSCLTVLCACGYGWKRRAAASSTWLVLGLTVLYAPQFLA